MSFLDTRPAPLDGHGEDDPLAEFRCSHPREVLSLLRELRDAVTPLALSAPDGANLGATVWTVDAERQRMAFAVEPSDPQLPALVEADEAGPAGPAALARALPSWRTPGCVLVRACRQAGCLPAWRNP